MRHSISKSDTASWFPVLLLTPRQRRKRMHSLFLFACVFIYYSDAQTIINGFGDCEGRCYTKQTHLCCGEKLYTRETYAHDCCGSDVMNRMNETCCDGKRHPRQLNPFCCGAELYDPLRYVCCDGQLKERKSEDMRCCGNKVYDIHKKICCDGKTTKKKSISTACCGKRAYDVTEQLCCQKKIKRKKNVHSTCCNKKVYDVTTHLCCDMKVNRRSYVFLSCCGNKLHNYITQLCCDGTTVKKKTTTMYCCGTSAYESAKEMCCGGKVSTKGEDDCCGAKPYNKNEKLCCDGVLHCYDTRRRCCGKQTYDFGTQKCCNGNIVPSRDSEGNALWCCEQQSYTPTRSVCCSGQVFTGFDSCCDVLAEKCGSNLVEFTVTPYNRTTHACCNGKVVRKNADDDNKCCVYSTYKLYRQTCCGGKLDDYGPHNKFCCGSRSVAAEEYINCCDVPYGPKAHGACCGDKTLRYKRIDCCDGGVLYKHTPKTYDLYSCCGVDLYQPSNSICCGYAIHPVSMSCCGNKVYDPTTSMCCLGTVHKKISNAKCCRDQVYDSAAKTCCDTYRQKDGDPILYDTPKTAELKCCFQSKLYNSTTHKCCSTGYLESWAVHIVSISETEHTRCISGF